MAGQKWPAFLLFRRPHGQRLQKRIQKVSCVEKGENTKSNEKHSATTYGESRSSKKGRRKTRRPYQTTF